jgi:hypothetical protein
MTETTSEPTTLETWYGPGAGEMKLGPGDPSPDLTIKPDPWNVLRFSKGLLTVDTEDAHYPEWRKWLDATAPAYGLRIVTEDDAAALLPFDPNDKACPETNLDETNLSGQPTHFVRGRVPCTFRAPTTREIHQHMLAVHKPRAGK